MSSKAFQEFRSRLVHLSETDSLSQQRVLLIGFLLLCIPAAISGSILTPNVNEAVMVAMLAASLCVSLILVLLRQQCAAALLACISFYTPVFYTLYADKLNNHVELMYWTSWMVLPVLLSSFWLSRFRALALWVVALVMLALAPVFNTHLPYVYLSNSFLQFLLFGGLIFLGQYLREMYMQRLSHQGEQLQQQLAEKQQLLKALEDRDQVFRRSQEFSAMGFWVYDLNAQQFEFELGVESLLGFGRGQDRASYAQFLQQVYAADREMLEQSLRDCVEHDVPYKLERRVDNGRGGFHWVLEHGNVERDAQGLPSRVIAVVRDIHERKISEALSQQKSQSYFALFHQSSEAVFILHRYRIADCNPVALELMRAGSRRDLLGMSWLSFAAAAEQEVAHCLQQAEAGGKLTLEFACEDYCGQSFQAEARLSPVFWEGEKAVQLIVRNISLRQQQTRHLQKQQIFYQQLSEISDILSASQTLDSVANTLLDRMRDNFSAQRAWLLYPCDPDAEFWSVRYETTDKQYPGAFQIGADMPMDEGAQALMSGALQAQGPVVNDFRGDNKPRLASVFQVKSQLIIVVRPQGAIPWMLGIHRCVGDELWDDWQQRLFAEIGKRLGVALTIHNLMNNLREAKLGAEQASQAKTRFLSSMSHELRTPMNAIMGFSQLLELTELNDNQQDYVKEISSASQLLLTLINDMLDLTRIESGDMNLNFKSCSLQEQVQQVSGLLTSLAQQKQISIELDTQGMAGVLLHVDPVRFRQILVNLISNAIKYNTEQGWVRISYRHEQGQHVIDIRDSGIGIDMRRADELFVPFSRLDAENSDIEGTGIGLANAKKLAILMQGDISVSSEAGVGSCFSILLPAIAETATVADGVS